VNYLLDTCTFIWLVTNPTMLSVAAAQAIGNTANTLFLSVVSAWEIAVLYSLGRLALPQPPEIFVPAERGARGIRALTLEENAAVHEPHLPRFHRDPFDRMLICQARVNNLTILTPDPIIRQYPVLNDW
jgi:PIN domain nuclease of toxin-antitoxin system